MFNFGHSHFLLPHHVSVVILAWELTHVLEVVEQKNGDTEQERGQDDQDDKQAAVWGYNSVVNFKKNVPIRPEIQTWTLKLWTLPK